MTTEAKSRRTPSLRDVADRAQVSPSTVSLVLNGKAAARGIPETTADRVTAAAEELGYRPNAMAAGLRKQTSDTIGLVSDEIATSPHAGSMIQGAHDAAWEAGKVLMIVNTGGDPSVQNRAIEIMLQRQAEGFIFATMYHKIIEPPAALRELPAVLLDCRCDDETYSWVVPDEEGGAFAATTHLLEAGHRRIGCLESRAAIPATAERLRGYRSALESFGIEFDPELVTEGLDEFSGGVEAASELLDRAAPPSAIFCFNDRMAAGAVRAAHRRGLVIPRDLSIVGYDNEELVASYTDPPLTTVQLPHYEMGHWAVTNLLGQMSAQIDGPTQERISCPLVIRDSVAGPGEPTQTGDRSHP